FENLDTAGIVRFAAEQVVDTVADWTFARQLMQSLIDAVPSGSEDFSVLDRSLQVKLFAQRADDTLKALAQRLRAMSKQSGSFQAFNHCQDHVLSAARAFMDRTVLEAFVDAIDRCEDDDVRQLLNKLCDLHACSVLERERAWFLEHGLITSARAKSLVAAVNELCRDLAPYAQILARSTGVPKELVRAPIALRRHGESYLDARDRLLAEGVIGHG
ncbi:MAG: acyl-CoA oxidase, partial [Glaciecola sp.]